jgi:DnaJ-class molecular chaperone
MAYQYHPDRAGGKQSKEQADKFKEITAAYSVLGNAKKKLEYDNLRKYT